MFEIDTATDYIDLLQRLETFLTAKGSAFGLEYTGVGDGRLTDYSGGTLSVAETFTITATSPTQFSVIGSESGDIGPATVDVPFVDGVLEFTINDGATPFVAGDVFTLSTAPKWKSRRKALGCRVLATQGNAGIYAAQNLVDGKLTADTYRSWRVDAPVTIPQDIEFTFFEAEEITEYHLIASTSYDYAPKSWTFDYWDGDSWETLDTQTDITGWAPGEIKQFVIASPVSATKYRLHITAIPYTSLVSLGAIRLVRSAGIDAAFSQLILEAPGNDGDSQIFVGMHAFERQDADYFNWELITFDGYNASAHLYQQAGCQRRLYLPLWDASLPYWFICDGRRVVVIAKISTQYEMAYLGFFDPYFSPQQWPYPMAHGGSLALTDALPTWENTQYRWSNSSNNHRMPTHSDPGTAGSVTVGHYQLRSRNLDGSWDGYEASIVDSILATPGATKGIIWPYRCGISLLDTNLDDSHTLWPVMLCHWAPNTLGQLSGLCALSGQDLTAETLLRSGAIDWMVLPNITRTDRDDFLAVALD